MGTQHLRIPRGLLRSLCYSGGIRLPQLIKPETVGVPDMAVHSYQVREGVRVVHPVPMTYPALIGGERPVLGNLGNEAYRFFRGDANPNSTFIQCRGCLEEEMDIGEKVKHIKSCRPFIESVIELVLRDSVCLICHHITQARCWTIPLCSEACKNKWRFSIPMTWAQARNLALRENRRILV